MKRERIQLINLLRAEIHSRPSILSTMRLNFLIVGFFTLVLVSAANGKSGGGTDAHLSFTSLPFLRGGGYVAFAPSIPKLKPTINRRRPFSITIDESTIQWINHIRHKIQSSLNDNIGREWGKLGSAIGRVFTTATKQGHGTRTLDEVLKTFRSVRNGNEVDTAQLLKACRAHLVLMKTGGAALKVVARDMEATLNKAESLFNNIPKEDGRHLASLLDIERKSGIHDGNELKNESGAMGLLWLRRSLDFQLDLYSSLIPSNGQHPKDAAMKAYYKTLSPYHGWLLQKLFPASLTQMPDRKVFIAKFGGIEVDYLDEEYEKEIVRKLKSLVNIWEPIINTWRNEYERLDLEDIRRA